MHTNISKLHSLQIEHDMTELKQQKQTNNICFEKKKKREKATSFIHGESLYNNSKPVNIFSGNS